MALRALYEGTPESLPVEPLNLSTPKYWEAGAIGMLNAQGQVVVSDGTAAMGVLADRRNVSVGISSETYLVSKPGQYGDESFFNEPNINNGLYGVGAVIPPGTVPTTGLLRDETASNPNINSRMVSIYTRGGTYQTDQFDTTQVYNPQAALYVMTDGTGRLTSAVGAVKVGFIVAGVDGNNVITFQSQLL